MNILVLNCGSSSLKYRLIAMPAEEELAGGEAQRVGPPTAEPSRILHHGAAGERNPRSARCANHAAAFEQVMRLLERDPRLRAGRRRPPRGPRRRPLLRSHASWTTPCIGRTRGRPATWPRCTIRRPWPCEGLPGAVPGPAAGGGVRHRLSRHDPGLRAHLRPAAPICARTGHPQIRLPWHQPPVRDRGGRRLPGSPLDRFNAVSCHLGSGGASLCAIVNGQSVDNTMGYSPLQGLVMSTRCGDLDPAVTLRLLAHATDGDGAQRRQAAQQPQRRAGPVRHVGRYPRRAGAQTADRRGRPAHGSDTRRSICGGSASTSAPIWPWSAGPTPSSSPTPSAKRCPQVRWAVCAGMEASACGSTPAGTPTLPALPADVAGRDSPVRILVIATNEELAIARQTERALN